jgi:phage-related protein (TIGR01555 family)
MLINKGTEEMGQQNTPLGTLDALQAQSQEHMAAPCHIPLIKLFGVVPTGLNATGEGEIQVWYDFVRSRQENLFGPQFDVILKLIQLDLFGSIDPNIGYEWVPLDEPTAKEKAEERKSDAERDTAYINAGVVDPDEVREKLQRDPNSGYDNLSGPAPGPPALPMDPNAPPLSEDDESSDTGVS